MRHMNVNGRKHVECVCVCVCEAVAAQSLQQKHCTRLNEKERESPKKPNEISIRNENNNAQQM